MSRRGSQGLETDRSVPRWLFVPALALLVGLTACAELDHKSVGEPDSVHLTKGQFEDIPVPYGFKLMERSNDSLIYEHEGLRVGQARYRGPEKNTIEMADFYLEYMPNPHGWEFVNESDQGSRKVLEFAKERYRCNVNIYNKNTYGYIEVRMRTVHES